METEQNCNILTPTLLAITAFLSRSPGQLNRGLGPSLSGCWFSLLHLISNSSDPQLQLLNWESRGPLLLVAVFSTASFSNSLIPNCSIGGPEGPFCRVLFSLQHHFSNSVISNCSIGGPEGPFCRVLFSLHHHFSNSH